MKFAQCLERPRPSPGTPKLRTRNHLRDLSGQKSQGVCELRAGTNLDDQVDVVAHDRERPDFYAEAILGDANNLTNDGLVPTKSRTLGFHDEVIRSSQRNRARDFSSGIFLFSNQSKCDANEIYHGRHNDLPLSAFRIPSYFHSPLCFGTGAMGPCASIQVLNFQSGELFFDGTSVAAATGFCQKTRGTDFGSDLVFGFGLGF